MSGIFGILSRNGAPLAPSALENMTRSLAHWEGHSPRTWNGQTVGLGVAALCSTPEIGNESLPRCDRASNIAVAASGRLDNRTDLARTLEIAADDLVKMSDGELMLQAYLRWENSAPEHLLGDWSLAAWNPSSRMLFLARDHFGMTSLFYHADLNTFAFAPTRQALLDLNLRSPEMDELYLAQVLVAWPAYHGERTIHRGIQRLPPAHALVVTPTGIDIHQYWRMEDVQETRLPRTNDYVEALTSVFDQAVRTRLRTPVRSPGVAVTLSGGLDSSSVTAFAAAILQEENRSVGAFVSVPLTDSSVYSGDRFADEYPFAAATAQFAGNVDLHVVLAQNVTPIAGIRRQLEILNEPSQEPGNAYWILETLRIARAQSFRVLLTGQQGKPGMSWAGDPLSQPLGVQLRQMHLGEWSRAQFKTLKDQLSHANSFKNVRVRREQHREWYRRSAIRLDFAQRLNLLEQRLSDPGDMPSRGPLEHRYRMLLPGRSTAGATYAELGAAYGLEVRDPTADVRVLQFALSVPDAIFIDPQTATNRWLVRETMKGRLPEEIRLNRRRGRQAADLVPRLRASAAEVDGALNEMEAGAAAAYLDVPYMRQVWEMVKTQDTPESLNKARGILARGIGAGLFVNQFAARPAMRSRAAAAYSSS
jgi:asparagine synthase (glutamine-hydrolysing)